MKHLKKSLALILVFAMTFIAVAPLSEVFADSLEVKQEEPKLEISELKEDLTQAVKSVEEIEPADEKYKEVMDQFYEAHDFLDKEIKIAEMKQRQAVGSAGAVGALENTIYDLTTIPVRVQLMIRIGRAISINKTTKISLVVRPNEVKDKEVFIYSSNAFMARVVGNTIIPLRTGTVMITVVSKDGCAKSNFELHIVEPGHSVSGIPFLQATGENSEYLNTSSNGGGVVNDNPYIQQDSYEVKNIGFSVKSTTLKVGDTFDLASKTFVFPENALEKEVSYKSDNEAIATVNEKGTIKAVAEGSTTITATTKNGVTNKFKLNVIKKVDKDEYQITEINPSERRAGIFSIEFKATKNGKKYNGPAKVTVSNTKKAIVREVYFNNGVASVKYNGFEFGTWVKDFNVKIELKDQVKTFELNY